MQSVRDRISSMCIPVTESGCHLWTANIGKDGYGKIKVNGKTVRAHRMTWQLANGEIPSDALILHKCDVKSCVNPDHLYAGTYSDNAIDRRRLNYSRRGGSMPNELNPFSKFSNSQVEMMRKTKTETGESNKVLAKRFGISESHLSHILNNLVRKV